MGSKAGITFVCCVESGALEAQTVRLVTSLRKYGGRFANAPMFAVTPRFGPPLSKATQDVFAACQVTHLKTAATHDYAWFNFYNKPYALVAVQEHIQTDTVCFLDSDLLIVAEPDLLELAPDEDFLAFPVECKEMGTAGPGDPYEEFWRASCQVAGLELDALPWITTAQTQERVRLYFNSGIFVYRRDGGFAAEYLRLCKALMDSGIGTNAEGYGLGYKEMVSVGFAVLTLGLRWRALPYSYNYLMSSATHKDWYSRDMLQSARIIHYHDAMWPPFWQEFLSCMKDTHPQVAAWLESRGPMKNEAPAQWKILSKYLRARRKRQAERYREACTVF